MPDCTSEISLQSLEASLNDLSRQVPALRVLLSVPTEQQLQLGYYHTLREICQQPLTWQNTAARVRAYRDRLGAILTESGVRGKQGTIILTGSGSSLLVGECLNLTLQHELDVPVQAVPAGLVLTHAELALPPHRDCLVVSFARSGDSPESLAAVELLRELNDRHRHLIVTCNRNGKLVTHQHDSRILPLVLDDATCDRSLVMTSSFTNMLWAARSLGLIDSLDLYWGATGQLARIARELMIRYSDELSKVGGTDFQSAVYLGSGVRLGAAREAALKMLEMTAGKVRTFAETYLGVRHGPLSAILDDTLIVCFLSEAPVVRSYELDLIRELNRKQLGSYKLILGEDIPRDLLLPGDLALECPGLNALGDENLPVLDVLAGQLLSFFRCLSLHLKPDSPSTEGIISRVVGEFTIHRKS
jgi:tagatose-6-phosphate ketose/aldose isomerase